MLLHSVAEPNSCTGGCGGETWRWGLRLTGVVRVRLCTYLQLICVVPFTDEADYCPGSVCPPAHHHKWVCTNIVEQFTSQIRAPAKTAFSFPIQFLWSSDIANVQGGGWREDLSLLPLLPLSLLPLPQGGACQHPSGLNLPLVQILSLVCSHKSAARSALRLGLIPDLWNMERTGNEGGLSMQFLRKLNSSVHVKDSISWYISHVKPRRRLGNRVTPGYSER